MASKHLCNLSIALVQFFAGYYTRYGYVILGVFFGDKKLRFKTLKPLNKFEPF